MACMSYALLYYAVASGTYYDLLAVDKSANADQIKEAYRKMLYNASASFYKIAQAYEVLGDSASRARYDRELAKSLVASEAAAARSADETRWEGIQTTHLYKYCT